MWVQKTSILAIAAGCVVLGAVSGALGEFWLGADASPESVEVGGASAAKGAEKRVDKPVRRGRDSDGTVDLTAKFHEAQLRAASARRALLEVPWPESKGAESPDQWVDTLERAIEECDLPFTIAEVECTAYPCMARVKAKSGDSGGLRDAMPSDCPYVEEVFSDAQLQVFESLVSCPDGSLKPVNVALMFSGDTLNEASDPYAIESDDWFGDSLHAMRLIARRYDAAVSTADCEEGRGG